MEAENLELAGNAARDNKKTRIIKKPATKVVKKTAAKKPATKKAAKKPATKKAAKKPAAKQSVLLRTTITIKEDNIKNRYILIITMLLYQNIVSPKSRLLDIFLISNNHVYFLSSDKRKYIRVQ